MPGFTPRGTRAVRSHIESFHTPHQPDACLVKINHVNIKQPNFIMSHNSCGFHAAFRCLRCPTGPLVTSQTVFNTPVLLMQTACISLLYAHIYVCHVRLTSTAQHSRRLQYPSLSSLRTCAHLCAHLSSHRCSMRLHSPATPPRFTSSRKFRPRRSQYVIKTTPWCTGIEGTALRFDRCKMT